MQRYQQSDPAAVTLLAEKLSRKLYPFFIAQTRDRERAKDLLQECWLRIHKARHTYRPEQPLLPWVFAIARHVRVDHYRRAQRIARIEASESDWTDAKEASYQPTNPASLDLWRLLGALPEQQRQTVLMLKLAGLSLQEVSLATGASVGAVKQRAQRAFAALRLSIGERR